MEENKNYEIEKSEENYELIDDHEEESSGIGAGAAMVLGSGITLGIIAAVKLIQKRMAKRRAKDKTHDKEVVDVDYEETD